MMVATDTTIVPSGIPRRSALPENLERHVSWGFGAIATSLAASASQVAVPRMRVVHVQA